MRMICLQENQLSRVLIWKCVPRHEIEKMSGNGDELHKKNGMLSVKNENGKCNINAKRKVNTSRRIEWSTRCHNTQMKIYHFLCVFAKDSMVREVVWIYAHSTHFFFYFPKSKKKESSMVLRLEVCFQDIPNIITHVHSESRICSLFKYHLLWIKAQFKLSQMHPCIKTHLFLLITNPSGKK